VHGLTVGLFPAAPRSGLTLKNGLDVGAGVIDEDYRGNVGVILFNHSDTEFTVKAGDRIAQLILERIVTPAVEEVEDLDVTDRGSGGFGSTGTQSGVESKKPRVDALP
jgi:dUTP pyrophosphatase